MKFKDLWIKPSSDDTSAESDATPPKSEGQTLTPPGNAPFSSAPAGDTDSAVFVQQLETALEKANLPSQQDYLDFAKSLKNMEKLPMDEATRYKAAYATLQSVGCDLKQLIESFDYYDGILDGEKDKFDEAVRSTVSDTVIQKERDIKKLKDENDDHAAEIQKLTAAINLNQESITKAEAELADVNAKLNRRKAGFQAAYSLLKQRLQGDKGKIQSYLSQELAAQSPKSNRK